MSAAATDAGAGALGGGGGGGGALHKIERAAIAAATPVSYSPQDLLLLIHEHLKVWRHRQILDLNVHKEFKILPARPLVCMVLLQPLPRRLPSRGLPLPL